MREELQRLAWPEEGLGMPPKGHGGKVILSCWLRQETTMSLKWIAERLQMGSWTYVSNRLNQQTTSAQGQPALALFN